MVPPLPLQGQRRPRRESASGSTPEIWPHAKNDDSCVFWTHLALLKNNLFDIFGVSISHGLQGCPKGSPRAPKRYPKTSPKVPKTSQGWPKASPRVPQDCQGTSKGPKDFPKGLKDLPNGTKRYPKTSPKVPQTRLGGEYLRWEGPLQR